MRKNENIPVRAFASGPRHVAMILDGNRRWAEKNGLPAFRGHYEGAKTLEEFINAIDTLPEVPFLTFWGGSLNNLTVRPKREIEALFDVYARWFSRLLARKELFEKEIKVRIIGDWERLTPPSLKKLFYELIKKTSVHQKYNLTFLIAYDGREEMLDAIYKIKNHAVAQAKSRAQISKMTEDEFKKHLWTGELPPVDLVIRTGIDKNDAPHWSSGFMMWLCANSQLYFTKTLWPDFTVVELKRALKIYAKTKRRFGR